MKNLDSIFTLPRRCKRIGKPDKYFEERQILLDCRGDLIIDPDSNWGWRVMVLTSTHDISNGHFGDIILKRVVVERGTWICSGAILYNCTIQEYAVVSAGSVVRNMIVPAHTMVMGNPAKIVAIFDGEKWRRVNDGCNI